MFCITRGSLALHSIRIEATSGAVSSSYDLPFSPTDPAVQDSSTSSQEWRVVDMKIDDNRLPEPKVLMMLMRLTQRAR